MIMNRLIDCQGDLYNTDIKDWEYKPPLRKAFSSHSPDIINVNILKSCLRAGEFTLIGGYPLYFITSDGGVLSFQSVKDNFREVVSAIKQQNDPQWDVVSLAINYENDELLCDHSGDKIKCAYL